MSVPIRSDHDYHVVAPPAHAGLTCRFLKPAEFTIADLPAETPDFANSAQFMPLAVAMSPYGPMVFTVAARPAFGDGTVSQWLDYICTQESYPHSTATETRIGRLPAVTCDATQQADDGSTMKMRFVLLEDGGRLFQMSAMAPDAFWSAALDKMAPMLASLELREARGTQISLFPGCPPPPPESPAEPVDQHAVQPAKKSAPKPAAKKEPTALMTSAEVAAIALADDASSLDEETPMNARLRNSGAGLVPRVASVDLAEKSARVAACAVQGIFRVPLGWHVIDDGKRTLVFDAGGKIQISLSQRLHEGASAKDFARSCLDQYLATQPDLPVAAFEIDGIAAAGVRGATIDGETLDQCFFVRDLGREGLLLVARATAQEADSKRGLDLAGDIMASFTAPDVAK
ncbi:MAG: hypothetical protein ABIQ12_01750 [Opitutaceae bacterium]